MNLFQALLKNEECLAPCDNARFVGKKIFLKK